MSQKTSYKAKVQTDLVLQDFRNRLKDIHVVEAFYLYLAMDDIPEEAFKAVWEEVFPEDAWRWAHVKRG